MRAQHELGYLINPDDNYRLHRERDIDGGPCLPFLFPIIMAAQWRRMALAVKAVEGAKLYTVESTSSLEDSEKDSSDEERGVSSTASYSTVVTPRSWYGRFLPRLPSCLGR